MQLITPADVVGDGVAHALSTIPGAPTKCKWFQLIGNSIGSIPGRMGDKNVSLDVLSPPTSGRGIEIASGTGQFNPPIALAMEFYDLTQIYYVLAVGDTATPAFGV